jgi:hypothetical protein
MSGHSIVSSLTIDGPDLMNHAERSLISVDA